MIAPEASEVKQGAVGRYPPWRVSLKGDSHGCQDSQADEADDPHSRADRQGDSSHNNDDPAPLGNGGLAY